MLLLLIQINFSGSDEASQFKNFRYQKRKRESNQEDEPMEEAEQPPAKKQKCDTCGNSENKRPETKSLFSSQASLVQLHVNLPGNVKKIIWQNEYANSIFGHQPTRHRGASLNHVEHFFGPSHNKPHN